MEEQVEYNAGKNEKIAITILNGKTPLITKSITREESIDKMAKAMYTEVWKSKTPLIRVQNWEAGVTEQIKKKYRKQAEAALDALLKE